MKRFIDNWLQSKIARLQLCPLPKPLTPISDAKVLVFAPHPDDETLGCGGTLALLQRNNCAIKVVFVTDGSGGSLPEESVEIRRREAMAALSTLGINDWLFLDEPDGNFRSHPKFEQQALEIMRQFQPDWLFVPSILDYHRDHVAIGQALVSIWQVHKTAKQLFFYEIWSPVPATHMVDITSVIDLKQQAIRQYQLPLAHCDYLSASTGLSRYRGLYLPSQKREQYAEAFVAAENNKRFSGIMINMLQIRLRLEKFLLE